MLSVRAPQLAGQRAGGRTAGEGAAQCHGFLTVHRQVRRDGEEMESRWRADGEEIESRWRGDGEQIERRRRGDGEEI